MKRRKAPSIEKVTGVVRALFNEHGLTKRGWKFKFTNATRSEMVCHHSTKTIRFSWSHFLNYFNHGRERKRLSEEIRSCFNPRIHYAAKYLIPEYRKPEPIAERPPSPEETAKLDQVAKFARQLMEQHGLIAKGWKFKLGNAVHALGSVDGSKVLRLSRHLVLNSGKRKIRNTLLHEIAHALVGWRQHRHDKVWRAKAISIGCDGEVHGDMDVPPPTWIGECPKCHRKTMVYRRGRLPQSCGICADHFDPTFLLVWSRAK